MGLDKRERPFWVALHEVDGLGPKRLQLVMEYFGSAKTAWAASKKQFLKIGLAEFLADRIIEKRRKFNPWIHLKALARLGVRAITVEDEEYPNLLKQIDSRPNVLYLKGKFLSKDNKAIAVVGTRKVTPYGRRVTRKLVAELVNFGFTVVSGLARGVDGVAHRTVLERGGRTVAVLGCGIDQVYPPEHKNLAAKIARRGVLVSEFPPGYKAVPGSFPARNRIISGLSLGVLVTEGAAKSGTKITATHALDQGREVMAVPGPITSRMSQAPLDLIKLGAKPVSSAKDIIEELQVEKIARVSRRAKISQVAKVTEKGVKLENELEKKLYQLLVNRQIHIDELIRLTERGSAEVSAVLTMMEMRGLVRHLGGMVYCRA